MHYPALAGLAALAFVLGSLSQRAAVDERRLDLCEYRLFWADEFDDLSIAAWRLGDKRWIAHTPWAGDFGDAQFLDPGPDGPFAIENGTLVITARKRRDGRWTSGLIAATDTEGAGTSQQYGYFEARMKVSPGPGTWPAFWLYSHQSRRGKTPDVEIDVMEFYGHDPGAYYATWHIHHKPLIDGRKDGVTQRIPIPGGGPMDGFHRFGVDVSPDQTTYYFERRPVWQHPTPAELKAPLFPLVNLALGSGYSIENTPSPSRLEIDYVRLYARLPEEERGDCEVAKISARAEAPADQP